MKNLFSRYLLMNPGLRGVIEWSVLVVSGIAGLLVSVPRLPGFPVTLGVGLSLFSGGLVFHVLSERNHREAHRSAKVISSVIDTGMYGKIRHPLYAGLIVSNLGIGLAFGVYWTLGLAVLFSVLYLLTAVEEEKYLPESLGDEYTAYKERVRWRMIPGIF